MRISIKNIGHRFSVRATKFGPQSTTSIAVPSNRCYRTFPVFGWACSFPSAQQACTYFFRVIYVGGHLKGPQLTTAADTLTLTRYCVLSLILFDNWNIFYKREIRFCLIYSNNQWKIQKLIGVTTALAVNTELHTNLFLWHQLRGL